MARLLGTFENSLKEFVDVLHGLQLIWVPWNQGEGLAGSLEVCKCVASLLQLLYINRPEMRIMKLCRLSCSIIGKLQSILRLLDDSVLKWSLSSVILLSILAICSEDWNVCNGILCYELRLSESIRACCRLVLQMIFSTCLNSKLFILLKLYVLDVPFTWTLNTALHELPHFSLSDVTYIFLFCK